LSKGVRKLLSTSTNQPVSIPSLDVSDLAAPSAGYQSDDLAQSPTFKMPFNEDGVVKSPTAALSMDDIFSTGGGNSTAATSVSNKTKPTATKHMLSPRLLELIVYCKTKSFRGFTHALGKLFEKKCISQKMIQRPFPV
jgi:hypothetical protein